MPSWVLQCVNCKNRFEYAAINTAGLLNYFQPLKPEFPPEGIPVLCPQCGQRATYHRHELTYRH